MSQPMYSLLITVFLVMVSFAPSHAIKIDYSLAHVSGNTYRYDYSVTNDGSLGAGTALQLFDIEFDPSFYLESSLNISSLPALSSEWAESFLASAPGVPAVYDVAALGAGIPVSGTVKGFAVQFDWLDPAKSPAFQAFQVYDLSSFQLLETGVTTSVAVDPPGNNPIPEPSTIFLLGIGLIGVRLIGKKQLR